ncbi:unnamed protein product [Durusdinium trenchii]|uniref:Uncharacterized protein n=1 Tax=Durusdinium trenchii TaxID=1381693 RepID=A0ABP0HE71_9DINO
MGRSKGLIYAESLGCSVSKGMILVSITSEYEDHTLYIVFQILHEPTASGWMKASETRHDCQHVALERMGLHFVAVQLNNGWCLAFLDQTNILAKERFGKAILLQGCRI